MAALVAVLGAALWTPTVARAEVVDWLGACLTAGRIEAAVPCERALEQDPGNLAAERKLGWAYLATYRESEAVALFSAIVARHPADFQAHYDLAGVLLALRALEQAGPPVRQALRLRPKDPRALRMAGMLFESTGAQTAAFDIHLRLALAGSAVGMYDLAEDFALGRGTDADQKRARAWYLRAAEAGHVMAMTTLSEKLFYGAFGDPPDPSAAAAWQAKAKAARDLPN